MKTIFDNKTRESLIQRINNLSADSPNKWGKMNAYQMLKHGTMGEEMFQGQKAYKRLFIGRLFGPMALKGIIKDENPIKKNQPTHPEMVIKGTGDFKKEQSKWVGLLENYSTYITDSFVHPFFGKMDKEQIGLYIFKHTDHHLRQFGV
ncbi:DUF1569 domain-containing protein [Arcticibacterium luteifluviistationis]|uniref:DUF1569 domain-containing protein n=1 Tax=Arcticibacterium luteifluviistationis TaxID=1784714 RepID=A0A2Z4GB72_9BACT|nr:DUF1569 domain-containing protein [Arcticibacterium luteifluviistationis]AWV98447.1 hypothetical protein DJ013_09785 [Arcticibacterium luteifluviistationis]